MNNTDLLQALDRLKAIMIAVATGGPRIGEVQTEFAQLYDSISRELADRRIENPLPYRDLWEWYGRWSSGDLPSWQSRRNFVNDLFRNLTSSVQAGKPRPKSPDASQEGDPQQKTTEAKWDVFLSHAGEDKDAFARPLAERLYALGLRVWFDEFTLVVGDSLRRSIDRGLANSRYGIVVISPDFLKKQWPQRELDGMVAREVSGVKVILPVWHRIGADEIRAYSPTLADLLAVSSAIGVEGVANELLRAIQRDDELLQKNESPPSLTANPVRSSILTPAGNLIAVGPNLVCTGEILGIEKTEWKVHLRDFVTGDVGTLIRFVEEFDKAKPHDRYLLLNSIGDGRVLTASPSLTKDGAGYLARCPIAASAPRVKAQDLPSDLARSTETNDRFVEKGNLAQVSGVDALPQKVRSVLSHMKGESPFHRDFGTRLQEFYWRFRETPLLESILKLEVIRQASIPYNDPVSHRSYTPLHCVEHVRDIKILSEEPKERRIPIHFDLDVTGLGRWEQDLSILMPPVEIVSKFMSQ